MSEDGLEVIGKEDFDNVENLPEIPGEKVEAVVSLEINTANFQSMLDKMKNPVDAQKEMAVKIKLFLDKHMESEMSTQGFLSDYTRRWVKDYNDILEKIQKALYGDKSTNLHLHNVTHSQIAAKIRKSKNGTKTDK